MRSPLFVFVLFGLVSVSIAELRHAYENIAFFLAYRAELILKPEAERIIGIRCTAADADTGKCLDVKPKYTRCHGTARVKKPFEGRDKEILDACNLREFLSHISGGKSGMKGEGLSGELMNYRSTRLLGNENALSFDVDYAANRMKTLKVGDRPGANWCKIKDGADGYERTVTRFGQRLADMKAGATPEQLAEVETMLKQIDKAVEGVITDRECDMSRRLIPKLREKNFQPLVIESVSGGRQNFKEDETIDAIKDAWKDKPDGEKKAKSIVEALKAAIKAHFNVDADARNHRRIRELFVVFRPRPAVEDCSPRTDSV